MVFDLGLTDFATVVKFQKETFERVRSGDLESALILCQHYPVITMGRLANRGNILLNEQELRLKDISIHQIERGGEVTCHNPGQVMAYPIFNLNYLKKDIHLFLRQLEGVVIALLSEFGLKAVRRPGMTGVWLGAQKISSVGIAIKSWVTFHGLSINVKKESLSGFSMIRPCGMDIEMTSLETALKRSVSIDAAKAMLISKFRDEFLSCVPKESSIETCSSTFL